MSRATRRAQVRNIRRHRVDDGCNCNPPVRGVDDEFVGIVERAIGRRSRGAFDVLHKSWCPAGQVHQEMFDAGVLPVVVFNSGPRCSR